jgi:ketosteroid isomerase-like protein
VQIKKVTSKVAILKLIDDRLKAFYDNEIDALLSNYTPDIRAFNFIDPQPYIGADTVIAREMDDIITFASPRN